MTWFISKPTSAEDSDTPHDTGAGPAVESAAASPPGAGSAFTSSGAPSIVNANATIAARTNRTRATSAPLPDLSPFTGGSRVTLVDHAPPCQRSHGQAHRV